MMRVEGINGAAEWISRYKSLSKGKDKTETQPAETGKNRVSQNSSEQESSSDIDIKTQKKLGIKECKTCANRKYQDGSTDGGVSFKAPAHISPQAAPAAVRSHEQEHVANEQAKAQSSGKEVISQYVRIFTAVCPECGRVYVSGGETVTTTMDKKNSGFEYDSSLKYSQKAQGNFFDRSA
jgi:predicted RNA-binding Zn-ribbon protein involved in translation (DUF1610 family)